MKGVKGTRCGRRFFISSAGMKSMSPSIQSLRSFAVSPGRSIEVSDQRKRICIRGGADDITAMTEGSSCHGTEGIERTMGAAKTLLTRSIGL